MVAALTIAGSDNTGRAGLQADLRTFAAFGVWGTVAVTAVTAQDDHGVHHTVAMPPESVRAQIETVLGYTAIGAVKTGMLATAELTEEVATLVEEHGLAPLVVDPVVMATSGGRLLEEKGVRVLRERLLPRCTLFTPNIPEAEILLGRSIRGRDQMVEAAAQLALFGPAAVLLKGGHLEGDESPDILWHGGHAVWLEGRRRGGNMSGTGCTLSAAIAANLALSADLEAACVQAKAYVAEVIGTGIAV